MPDAAAVSLRQLTRVFGDKVAVDHLDLEIPRHTFFGICGPNGAGKTTALRMATGLLRPTSGQVLVDGVDVWAEPVQAKARFGLVPDTPKLFDRLSGHELLTFNGLLRGMDPDVVEARARELVSVLDLTEAADTLVADYSLGMTKKVAVAAALLHSPAVVFLDEPFGAIDPVSTQVMEDILRRYIEQGGTVIFSSHVMDVVERLCDNIAIISRGQLVTRGTVPEVTGGRRLQEVFIELVGGRADLTSGELGWLGTR
jgi:ABC-2 type transport system ATP-binding protein